MPPRGGVCNIPWLIFHLNNNKTKVMGHVFQAECLVNIIVGITCSLFMAMEIRKDIGKGKEIRIGV